MFSALNLPDFELNVKTEFGKRYIFDRLRKKFVVLTPEEWVRQHFVHYLLNHKKYLAGRIGNEISLIYNGLKKRCDTVVYDDLGQPVMIIEYKAPTVSITQETFDQISVYNLVMKVPFLVVSNGMNHYCCQMNYDNHSYSFLEEIPDYQSISNL